MRGSFAARGHVGAGAGFRRRPLAYASVVLTFQIVGSGGFKSGPRDGRVEIGYGIAPMCRRRGYGTEGVRLLVEEAFASERIDEVFAEVAVWNEASQSLLRKIGFRVLEGIIGDEGPMDIWGLQKRPNIKT